MITIAPQLSWPSVDGELAIHDSRDGQYHVLNGSAAAIWRAIANGKAAEAIARDLAEAHGLPVEQVREDVGAFIASALQLGLLVDA